MRLGLALRTMGAASRPAVLLECARAAEACGVDDLWVADHVAIPPDDAEGSDGRYLDPLATLAWLAAATERVGLGTGVLVLPYRPPEALDFLARCFADDVVEANGQPFLFRPRPPRPPVLVGGAAAVAHRRAVRAGADGWMPIGADPAALRPQVARLQALAAAAGRGPLEVVCMTRLPLEDPAAARERAAAFAEAGATRLVHGFRYAEAAEFARAAESLAALR
jgi:alkanesulfonate monooxygenase SsuD/methylene tetrahydromethanopterin reductase-like flavin-dependent oxidoreductase (luciferase family)